MFRFILPLFVQVILYSCDMPKYNRNVDVNKPLENKISDSSWLRKEVFTNEPSRLFAYEISFTKGDSLILYTVDSKEKNTCKPQYINYLMIKVNKDEYISVAFKDLTKVSKITPYYMELDFSSADEMWIHLKEYNSVSKGIFVKGGKDISKFFSKL